MKNFLLLTLTLLFVTLSSWAQPPDINNSTWVGWTDKGSSIATGVYARGAKANDYQIFTTVFIYDNANPVPGTSSGFTAGHKIMAVGIRNNSGATGSPSVKFDPNNNSFSPSPDGTVNGQASFSGSCDLGDWVVNTSGGNPQEITIRSANPYTATNDYYLPNGGNWGGPGQPGFRGINPSTGVWKVFFDLDQMTAEFGLGGSRNIVGKPTLGAFGSTIAIAIGGLGGTEAVVQNIGIVQPVHLYSDNTFTTWLSDYSTIQAGINAAVAGNALRVDAGTYTEALVINKALTILGPNAAVSPNGGSRVAEAVIDLTGGSVIKIAADNIILKGFKIVNLNQQGAIESGGGLSGTTAAANVTIEKNIFDNLKGDAIYTSGSISNWTITDNKIQNVTTYTTGGSYGCGMGFWLGASNVTITNNTISNVSWEGIQFVCYVTPASNILVQNNTITNVAHSGMNIASNLNNVQILGNTITNANTTTTPNEGGMIIQGLGTVTNALISGNIISGSYNGIYVLTGFDLTGKGLLVNNNNLSGNANKAINNAATGTLAATCNWYGTNVSATVAGMISGSVTYDPYLVTSAGPCGFPVRVYDNTETTLLSSHVTIQAGINAAVAGNVIRVDAGTYTESLYIDKALTILGPNATVSPNGGSRLAEAIIDLSVGSRMINLHANNITFKGFEIKNSANAGAMMAGGFSQCILVSDITIEKNYFHDLNGCAIVANNGWSLVTSKWTVTDNKINATTFGTYYGGGYGSGIKIWGGSNCSITNNVLSNIGFTGIDIAMMQTATISGNSLTTIADNGIQVVSTNSNVTISNNTITNANYPSATLGQGGIKLFGSPTNLSVTGNTVTGCGSAFAVQSGNNATGAAVNSNNFAGNTYGVYHAGTGTLNATCNWYGTTVPATLAAMISGPVTYSPYKYSINGICPPPTPATTIGTPINVSCGVYDVDVKVSNFTEVGAVSLVLNYNASVLGTPTFSTTNGLEADLTSVPNQVRIAYFGDAKTLADNAVLFTLHFVLPPTLTGTSIDLTWSSLSGDCEYAGPGGDPVYTSIFTDLTAWAIPARPVVNTNTLLEYCTIQAAISDPATNNLVGDHDVITVDGVLYAAKEQVIVNKEVTIQGINGQPTVELLGTVTGKPTLFDVSANNVTIDNIHFNVDLAKLRSAIVATSAGLDNIIITNNVIDCYGTPAGSYGERNAVSVNYAAYRVATGGVDNITFTGNTVNAGTYPIMFRSGISVDEGEGTFSGNTLKTINQDILVRFAVSGNVTVSGNHANGGGMEFVDFNAGTGTLSITGNFFNGTFANTYSNALRLKNNYTGRTTVVSGNDFTGFEGNVAGYGGTLSLENYQAVTLDANTFTPLAGSTVYRHLTINTKEFSSSSGFYAPVIGATFTNNIFNGSGVLGGTALGFYNWDNDAPTFNAITIGTLGNENIFNNDIQKFIMLDNSTGTVTGTTMVPWAVNLNAEHNKFAMSPPILPSAMTLAELFALENKIDHKIDNKSLGFVTVKASNAYVTDMASATAINNDYTRIRNAVELVANNWTINLHGTFDWTEANAAASWALGNDGVTGNDDDYTILVPAGLTGVTFTAPEGLGFATIQGPGDLAGANLEGTLNFWLGNNQNWTISNLEIFDFDLGIGMFYKNTTDFNNLVVTNNHIRIPKDLNKIVAPADVNQNIGIHYAFGTNQTFSNNIFDVEGDGVSDGANYSTSIVMQSNTSGGAVYDGLKIKDNTINVTGVPDATNPAVIRGIWENSANSNAAIEISGNLFTNAEAGNTADLNRQVAFWITSVSGASKKVEYKNNEVSGFNEGVAWIGGAYTSNGAPAYLSGQFPVEIMNNKFDGMKNAVVVRKAVTSTNTGSPALIKNNSFTNLVSGGLSVKNEGTGDAVSTCNWFGTTVPAAIAAQISGTATHIPWLYDGTDLLPATRGFQPSVVCDETPPVITCPANVTVNQHDARDPYATGYATVTIPADVITFDDDRSGLNLCNATGVIIRTWTATDLAGNTATCNQTITVQDVDIPVVVVPANITVNTDPGQCSAVVNYIDPTATDFGYFQGFENVEWVAAPYATNPSTDWNKYPGPIARVASGTDLITSKSGSAHAVITEDSEGTGVFSRLGGYNNVFGNGFVTSVDVYLDVNDSKVGTSTYGWEVTSAVSNQATAHLRDFVFHAAGVPGKIMIAATNNASNARRNDLASINHYDVTTSGWYTLKWTFRNNTGVLAVDCQLLNAGGSVLWTETRTAPTDLIASVVGGNRYMWFTFLAVDKLAIDNTTLTRNLAVTPASLSGTAFNKGVNTITANTTDACGHAGTNSFTITVNDNEKPLITCAPDVTINCEESTLPSNTGYTTATDNCGTPVVTYSDVPNQIYLSTDNPTLAFEGKARPGGSGYEAILYSPGGNPNMNPYGSAWVYGTYYNFEFTYTAATGTSSYKIDFNKDGDYLDAQESVTTVSPTYVGKGLKYVGFYLDNSMANPQLNPLYLDNFTINGTNLGSYVGTSRWLPRNIYQNSAGMFTDVVVTGSFKFSINGCGECYKMSVIAGVPVDLPPAPTCPQNYTINRVWKAADAIGNQSMCIQNITVHDVTPPVLAAAPAPVSVQCISDVPAMTSLTWTDNCSAGGSVSGTDAFVGGSCGGTITRTWNVSDACGNPAITRTQIITIQHTILPTEIGGPVATSSNVECVASAIPPTVFPLVKDVCGNTLTAGAPTKQLSFVNTFDAAPGAWYVDRYAPFAFTSPVSFDGGNRLMHSINAANYQGNGSFYNTQGKKFDLGTASNEVEIKLYIPYDWATSNKRMAGLWATAFDVSNAVSGYPIIEFTSDGNNPRFRAYDNGVWNNLGLPAGFVYNSWVTLKIRLLPTGECLISAGNLNYVTTQLGAYSSVRLGNAILQGHNYDPSNTAIGVTYDIYWDNFTYNDSYAPVTCEGAISYTYDYTDCSGLPFSWTYTYTIDHTTPPVVPANGVKTVSCPSNAVDPTLVPTLVDQQQIQVAANPNWTDFTSIGQSFTCGTAGWLTRLDLKVGSIVAAQNFTLQIYQGNGISGSLVYSGNHSLSATGWQSLNIPQNLAPYLAAGTQYTFWLTAFTYNQLGLLCMTPDVYSGGVAMDGCASGCSPTYAWQQWPAYDLIFKTYMTVVPVVTDVCGVVIPAPTPVQSGTYDGCEGTKVYTYNYADCSGLSTPWVYTYTIDYSGGLTPPANATATVSCPSQAVDPGQPAAIMDACGRTVNAILVTPAPTLPECNGTVIWRYRYTDCDGTTTADWTKTYSVTYSGGLTPPTPSIATVSCPSSATDPGAPASITDACGRTVNAVFVSSVSSPASLTCNGSVIWLYRYYGCDGTFTADWAKTYTVLYSGGLTPPTSGALTVSCPAAAVDPGNPGSITDACGRTVNAVLVGSTTPPLCNGQVVWTYRYTACDNSTADWTFTYSILYSGGLTPPANGFATVAGPAQAVDPGPPATITDACGRNVVPTLVGSSTPPACEGSVVWTYRYTACDGTTTADWTFTYTITKSTISGTVSYYNTANTPLNGLIVDLKQGASVIGTATTNSTGGYAISGICPGTYDVVISSTVTPVGGINATDAALVNSWSVSPYSIEKVKFYAGDAIMTNYLAPNDATRILKHFTSSLPWINRGNWSFWPVGDMISENPASPPVSIVIPQIVVTGSMTQNFYGLITGDFNSSYVPGSKSSLQSLTLNYDQVKEVELGKEYELPVNAGTTMEVGAVSLIMNFPADKLEVLGVYFGDNVNNPVEYAVNGNEIRIGWQSLDPVSLKVDEQLLTLKVRAIGSLDKDETIRFSLNADPLNELADGSYNTINGAVLKMAEMGAKALGTGEIPLASGLTLVNYPNPFIGTTTIAYTLPYDGKVSLEINNALGSKVKILVDEVQTAGDHTLTVNANELKPGVYTATLRLITSDALLNRTIKIVRNQ